MKKHFLILSALVVAVFMSYAQNKTMILPTLEPVHDQQLMENDLCVQIPQVPRLKSANSIEAVSAEYYIYSSLDDSTLTKKFAYEYNTNNLKTKETESALHTDGVSWYVAQTIDYIYNDNLQLTSMEVKNRIGYGEQLISNSLTEYGYDEYGNQNIRTSYSYDGTQYVGVSKYESTYDSNGNQTFNSSSDWENNGWICRYKTERDFNNDGLLIMQLDWQWDDAAQTLFKYRLSENEINSQGNVMSKNYRSGWNPEAMNWESGYRYYYHYADNATTDTHIDYYEWLNYAWEKTIEGIRYLDINENMNLVEWYYFQNGQKVYCDSKNVLSYDADGKTNLLIRLAYDPISDHWSEKNRTQYKYDNGKQILYSTYSSMDGNTKQWIGTRKVERQYDAQGRMIQYANYDWNPKSLSFYLSYKLDYLWDESGNVLLYSKYMGDEYGNVYSNIKETNVYNIDNTLYYRSNYLWSYNLGDWRLNDRIFYNYSGPSNSAMEVESEAAFVYQINDGVINIDANRIVSEPYIIKIYNTAGQLVVSKSCKQARCIVSGLVAGTYLISNSLENSAVKVVLN